MQEKFEKAQDLRNNNKLKKAIKLYHEVRKEALAGENTQLAAECLHMIGVAQYQNKQYKDAEEFYRKAQKEFEDEGLDEWVGFVLRDRGITARAQKKLDEAEKYLEESIKKLRSVGNKPHEGMSTVRLGVVYNDKGDFENAVATIGRGIALISETEDQFFLSSGYFDLAKVLAHKGNFLEAIEAANLSLETLNSFSDENQFQVRRKDLAEFLLKYKLN